MIGESAQPLSKPAGQTLSWLQHLALNSYWFGLNIASGIITPILLPYLVVLFMPAEQKNTWLANVRVIGLAVAMLVQPIAGMFSDRSTSRWGRRRPYIAASALLNVVFLALIAATPLLRSSPQIIFGVSAAYALLVVGIVCLQATSNIGQAAVQGLIPDLVPENQRGRSSGVKSVLELLPVFLVLFIGPLVDKGLVGVVVGIIMAGFLLTMLFTVSFAKEKPLQEKVTGDLGGPILRLVALTVIFVGITRIALWLVQSSGKWLAAAGVSANLQIGLVGLAGLLGMAGSIFIGVYFGAWVGIGQEARRQTGFIWWVVNRLLFLAAVGSIQGFAQYFLRDVLHIPNAASMTTVLLAVVALFLIPSALLGGNLADRIGRKRLVAGAGVIAAVGTIILLFATNMPVVIFCGALIGLGAGTFMATNWALGTDLVPPEAAGKYLGISNLAGAGAGIVGAGIGGPMADFFNTFRPGLGYLVIFAIYAALFLLSILTLVKVRPAQAG